MRKTIVCLANSNKHRLRCIAGREWNKDQPGNWIRPVSTLKFQQIGDERICSDGTDPMPLDVIEVPLLGPKPSEDQPENWDVDTTDGKWKYCKRLEWDKLQSMVDSVPDLWVSTRNSGRGIRNVIKPDDKLDRTLLLVRVPSVQILVIEYPRYPKSRYPGQFEREVRAEFTYNNRVYKLLVKDAHYEKKYLAMKIGPYDIDECYITISIVGPHNDGSRNGLVVAIMERKVLVRLPHRSSTSKGGG